MVNSEDNEKTIGYMLNLGEAYNDVGTDLEAQKLLREYLVKIYKDEYNITTYSWGEESSNYYLHHD